MQLLGWCELKLKLNLKDFSGNRDSANITPVYDTSDLITNFSRAAYYYSSTAYSCIPLQLMSTVQQHSKQTL